MLLTGFKSKHDDDAHINQKPVTELKGIAAASNLGAVSYLECPSHSRPDTDKTFETVIKYALQSDVASKKTKRRTIWRRPKNDTAPKVDISSMLDISFDSISIELR